MNKEPDVDFKDDYQSKYYIFDAVIDGRWGQRFVADRERAHKLYEESREEAAATTGILPVLYVWDTFWSSWVKLKP